MVRLQTNFGVIAIELDAGRAPGTVKNFLEYVESGFYSNTVFHRVIDGFMIQGGGFEPGMRQKPARNSIKNKAERTGKRGSHGDVPVEDVVIEKAEVA